MDRIAAAIVLVVFLATISAACTLRVRDGRDKGPLDETAFHRELLCRFKFDTLAASDALNA